MGMEKTRMYLAPGGKIVDGKLQITEFSLLDKPVDPNCYIDLRADVLDYLSERATKKSEQNFRERRDLGTFVIPLKENSE